MPKRFDENLARSLIAATLLFAVFYRSGVSSAQVGQSFSNELPLSLSDTTQSTNGPSIDQTNADLRVIIPLANGAIYQGAVGRDGKPAGQGTLTQPTGTILQGEWRDGKPYKLSGTSVFADNTREIGSWDYGDSKGNGKIVWPDGRTYKGTWKFADGVPDQPDGSGEMAWPDGRKYVGQFRNGKMYGFGKMTYPDSKVEDGKWKDDKFLGPAQ